MTVMYLSDLVINDASADKKLILTSKDAQPS